MNINLLGIDIAKDIFQLHGVNKAGHVVLKKRISRNELAKYIANLPKTEIAMESCGGANYWARVFKRSGHIVKLISPQFVKPFVKTNKNDANDAEAITEAASRPNMHFVPTKSAGQQDIQSLHRMRSRVMKNKIALINEIRGLNLEYGITINRGAQNVRKTLRLIIDDDCNELTVSTRELMEDLYVELKETEERLKNLDKKIKLTCKENKLCQRILTIPGIGELTASAIVASVGDHKEFKNGRHMAAWLGLVPKQLSSGKADTTGY